MAKSKTIPRGLRNNNPLNLIRSGNRWKGKVASPSDNRFEQFTDIRYGIRAAFINMRTIIKRNNPCTLSRLIEVWAPSFENDTQAYIKRVTEISGYKPETVLDGHNATQMIYVAMAMAEVENGRKLDFGLFATAWQWI